MHCCFGADAACGLHAPQRTCQICFEEFDVAAMCAARCRHFFCKDCWAGYVSHAIASGPSVLSLRCPIPACPAVVRPFWEQAPLTLDSDAGGQQAA